MLSESQFNQTYDLLRNDINTLFRLIFRTREPVPEGDIRTASVILRKWLIEGTLGQLTNASRSKVTFTVFDNTPVMDVLANTPTPIDYLLTGDIMMNERPVRYIYHADGPAPSAPILPLHEENYINVDYRSFMNQRRLFFKGTFFTTEDIIKYAANKLGGAHLDFNRPGTFQELERASEYMKYGGPIFSQDKLPGVIYMIFEPKATEVITGIHIEIMAAATSFMQLEFDGVPIVSFKHKRTIWSTIRGWLRGNNRRGIETYDLE